MTAIMVTVTDEEWADAVDGLHAYDIGSVDSGIHAEALRQQVVAQATPERLAALRTSLLSAPGYGAEDVAEFDAWWAAQNA